MTQDRNIRRVEKYDWYPEVRHMENQYGVIQFHVRQHRLLEREVIRPVVPRLSLESALSSIKEDDDIVDLCTFIVSSLWAVAMSHDTSSPVRITSRKMTRLPCLRILPGCVAPRVVPGRVPQDEAPSLYVERDDALELLEDALRRCTCSDEYLQGEINWIASVLHGYHTLETDLEQCSLLYSLVDTLM